MAGSAVIMIAGGRLSEIEARDLHHLTELIHSGPVQEKAAAGRQEESQGPARHKANTGGAEKAKVFLDNFFYVQYGAITIWISHPGFIPEDPHCRQVIFIGSGAA